MLTFHNPVDTGHQERNSLCNDCSIKSLPRIRALILMSLSALNSFFRGMIQTIGPASAAARLAGLAKRQPLTAGGLSGPKTENLHPIESPSPSISVRNAEKMSLAPELETETIITLS